MRYLNINLNFKLSLPLLFSDLHITTLAMACGISSSCNGLKLVLNNDHIFLESWMTIDMRFFIPLSQSYN